MTDASTPRPSIGRWLIAVPMGLVGLLLAGMALSFLGMSAWLFWDKGSAPHALVYEDGPGISGWAMWALVTGVLLFGLSLIAGAWLLVRRREGREG